MLHTGNRFPDRDPTRFCNSEQDPDQDESRKCLLDRIWIPKLKFNTASTFSANDIYLKTQLFLTLTLRLVGSVTPY